MQTSSYGVLPSKEAFEAAFAAECPDGWFQFGNCKRIGTCKLNVTELWNELDSATGENECTEESLDWASCVLYCLGFEWV